MDESIRPTPESAESAPVEEKKDLLDALLDLSFRTAITPKIIRWLYILGIVLSGVFAAKWVIGSFGRTGGIMSGMVSLMLAPFVFLLYALLTRIFLEIVQAIFSIAQSLKVLERRER